MASNANTTYSSQSCNRPCNYPGIALQQQQSPMARYVDVFCGQCGAYLHSSFERQGLEELVNEASLLVATERSPHPGRKLRDLSSQMLQPLPVGMEHDHTKATTAPVLSLGATHAHVGKAPGITCIDFSSQICNNCAAKRDGRKKSLAYGEDRAARAANEYHVRAGHPKRQGNKNTGRSRHGRMSIWDWDMSELPSSLIPTQDPHRDRKGRRRRSSSLSILAEPESLP